MTAHSLRFRLLVAAAISVSAALLIAGISLVVLFEHHVERRIGSELETYLKQIIAGVDLTGEGRITFNKELADPRFVQPLSGLYWQIQDEEHRTLLRSRSLWDNVVELPADRLELGTIHQHRQSGPAGQTLLVRERQVIFQPNKQEYRIRVAVAIDEQSLVAARNAFAVDMLPYLVVMAVVLLAAAWAQVRIGLAPLDAVRQGVAEISSGTAHRLEGVYPDEVMPLVNEMNGLLEAQERVIERSRAWTADLAHGLKTPLMVLMTDAQRLRAQGESSIAGELEQLAETMRRRVDRELVRARVRSGVQATHASANISEIIDSLIRTLKRTPRGALIEWSVKASSDIVAAISPDDLTELLGNVLENAAKWANEKVIVSVARNDGILIQVDDDGPGVADDQLHTLAQRGVRLDERKQGSGLGLAIARDVTEAYQGSLTFGLSLMGGLSVVLLIPEARHSRSKPTG